MSRGREFQVLAHKELEALKQEAIGLKRKFVSLRDEESANASLGFELAVDAVESELMMWVELKDDDPDSAWNHLVDAQMSASDAIRAHLLFSNLSKYARRLEFLEKMLFPPQTFSSIGSTATSLECSICGKESGECDHLPGRAYMGKICYRIVKGLKVKEISIVAEPGSKKSRITAISDGEGMRNLMTWRMTEEKSESTASL
jgi:hypothetical protein